MTKTAVGYRTLEEALQIARDLAPVLKTRVHESDQLRYLPPQNVEALLETGLVHLETPRRWGGPDLNIDALIEVATALAEGCSSTAWVFERWAAHVWLICQYPEHIQEKVLTDPRPLVSTTVNTRATVTRVDGGYLLNGKGSFSSGCDHATWLLVKIENVKVEEDKPAGGYWFLLPKGAYVIEDDWFTIGLLGTGSKAIVLNDVFVPDEYVMSHKDMYKGTVGVALHGDTSPILRASGDVVVAMATGATALGTAHAMVKLFEERCRAAAKSGADQTPALLRLAKAAAEVDSAHQLLMSNARRFGVIPASEVSVTDMLKTRRDMAYAAQVCRQAVNSLFEASGSASVYDSSEFSRLWRDENVAAGHRALRWDDRGLDWTRSLMDESLIPDTFPSIKRS